MSEGAADVFGRYLATRVSAGGVGSGRFMRKCFLEPDVELPEAEEVVFVEEMFAHVKAKVSEPSLPSVGSVRATRAEAFTVELERVWVFVAPVHDNLNDVV